MIPSSGFLYVGKWHHVVLTHTARYRDPYTAVSTYGDFRVFIDGVMVGSSPFNYDQYDGPIGGTPMSLFSFGGVNKGTITHLKASDGISSTYYTNTFVSNTQVFIPPSLENYTPVIDTNTKLYTAASSNFVNLANSSVFIKNGQSFASINPNSAIIVPISPVKNNNPIAPYSNTNTGGSLYFDGSSILQYQNPGNTFAIGTNNFTIEAWLYPTYQSAFSNTQLIFQYRGSTFDNINLWVNTQAYAVYSGSGGVYYFGQHIVASLGSNGYANVALNNYTSYQDSRQPVLNMNAWNHIALVRDSINSIKIYVNGIMTSSAQVNSSLSFTEPAIATNNPTVGGGSNGTSSTTYNYYGYLSNFRFLNGTAVYTSNSSPYTTYFYQPNTTPVYTPGLLPNKPFTSNGVVNTTTLTTSYNTLMLLSGTGAGIIDSAGKLNFYTVGSTPPYLSNTQSKFGNSSIYFPGGTSSALVSSYVDASVRNIVNGEATVEMWIYPLSYTNMFPSSIPSLIGCMNYNNGTNYWSFGMDSSGYLNFYNSVSGSITNTSNTNFIVPLNQWSHIALVKYGYQNNNLNKVNMYLNGNIVATGTMGGNISIANNVIGNPFITIGGYNTSSPNFYADEIRITKYARYYANTFTVPNFPFPNQ